MSKQQIIIPAELIPVMEAWGQITARVFGELRRQAGLVPAGVPEDQAWFWTPEWQAGEQEVDKELARGEYAEFESMEALIADLENQV